MDAEAAGVIPVEMPALAEDPLDAGVVPFRVVAEVDRADVVVPVVAPAGELAGLLADVALRVAPAVGADREQLHQLPAVVLVRRILGVVGPGEPEQHRRVLRHLREQRRERAEPVLPKELVLPEDQARVAGVLRGREPVVPDERHPLGKRAARPDHPVEPPELVVAPGVVRRERAAVVVVRLGAAQALAPWVRQGVDGVLEAVLGQALGLTGAWAETGAPKEALGLRLAEPSAVDGRHRPCIGLGAAGLNRLFGPSTTGVAAPRPPPSALVASRPAQARAWSGAGARDPEGGRPARPGSARPGRAARAPSSARGRPA